MSAYTDEQQRLRRVANDGEQEEPLADWWQRIAAEDAAAAAAKAAEYGSRDLTELGRAVIHMAGDWDGIVPDRVLSEVGCLVHLKSKLERAIEAIAHQRLPSDDTIHDVCVYAMMIRRIRATGEWS